ncbi:MAG: hypothetical protein HY042_01955 [Spirochaetia bacterium]|nr:hypothetical protein [Spirochaetia bacterium]
MNAKTRRVTANIPVELLEDAQSVTHAGITDTLLYGLELVRRRQALETARQLKGRLKIAVDLEVSRERGSN